MGYKPKSVTEWAGIGKFELTCLGVLMAAFITFVCIAVSIALTPTPHVPTTMERFTAACEERGGFVAQTDRSFWSVRVDCIVNNEVIYLPGFA